MVTKKDDRVEESIEKLISHYKESNVEDLLRAYSLDFQDFEDSVYDMFTLRWLDTSVGQQLDNYGGILDVDREGFDDDDYRIRIKARIIRYQSSGTLEEIIEASSLLTQARKIQAEEIFPARIRLTAIGTDEVLGSDAEIAATMKNAKAAGVGIESVSIVKDPPFSFNEDPDPEGEGYSDLNDLELGGYLAELKPEYLEVKDFGFDGTGQDSAGFEDGKNVDPLVGGYFISE